ncbi:hypothetical protein DWW52_03880 [Odoribacter sp. AF15-53]|nr:hypothetical protein DWW52_03880 [Odoribacter sp. AF15-53]
MVAFTAQKNKKKSLSTKKLSFFLHSIIFLRIFAVKLHKVVRNHEYFETIKQLKMKTILNLKQYVVLLIAAFAMTSCLDSEDDPFTIGGTGYIQQVVITEGEDGKATSSEFTPVILVMGNEVINSCSGTFPSGNKFTMTQTTGNPYYWITNTSLVMPSSTIPSGTFTISASNQEGEGATFPVSINNTTEMKTRLVGNIQLESNTIKAEFNKVENATNYWIILKQKKSDSYFESVAIIASYSESQLATTRAVTIDENTYASKVSNLTAGTYYLTIAATINSSSQILLYQESDKTAVFEKK